MIPTQPIQVTCPQCSRPFVTELHSIIDVRAQPALKEQLLSGQINIAQCPHCGAAGAIGAPILYHDADKELAYVLVPNELNLPHNEQEKLIGNLTNALMDALPAEQRKGYLLQPKTFLAMETFIRAILEAEGITSEMLEAQEKKLALIGELESRLNDEQAFEELVTAREDEIDYELFLLLNSSIDAARQRGREAQARRLREVRRRLVDLTGPPGGPIPVQIETFDQLLDVLREAKDDQDLLALVAGNRPIFDYTFFHELTGRIKAAQDRGDTETASQLLELRRNVLKTTEAVDQATHAVLQEKTRLLQEILQSDDPQTMVKDRLDEIDETFLVILSANIAQARDQGQNEIAGALESLYEYTLDLLEEQMPPPVRLVNQLLRAETPDERAALLGEAGGLLDGELVTLLRAVAADAQAQGQRSLARELQTIINEVQDAISR